MLRYGDGGAYFCTETDSRLGTQMGGCSRVATISDAAVAAVAPLTRLTLLDLAGSLDMTDKGACLPPESTASSHLLMHMQS